MKNLLFVDDEPKVLQGLQRQLYGMRNEWSMNFADGASRALDFMAKSPVDVIVTDMMMPGMDGAQLLNEVMKRHPNTIRIVLSGHVDRESVFRLVGPAHQYLSKPCEAEELRAAVSRAFALRDLLSNEQLKQLATRTKALPAMPAMYSQLTQELQKEDPSVDRVAEIIAKDMGMTSKILQLVNSAFFGLPQHIDNPAEAVAYLGLATVRALVLSFQVFSQFDSKKIPGFSIEGLAQHCWHTGMFARKIARAEQSDPKLEDQCFLAGLLHDVGQLILAAGMPDQYARVIENARSNSQSLFEAEAQEFGATHAEVGAYLLGLWGLPNQVVEAVAFHHRPGAAISRGFSAVAAVHVANAFAHEQSGMPETNPGNLLDMEAMTALGLESHLALMRSKCFTEEDQ